MADRHAKITRYHNYHALDLTIQVLLLPIRLREVKQLPKVTQLKISGTARVQTQTHRVPSPGLLTTYS